MFLDPASAKCQAGFHQRSRGIGSHLTKCQGGVKWILCGHTHPWMFLVFLLFSLVFISLLLDIAGTTLLALLPPPCHCFPQNPSLPALSAIPAAQPQMVICTFHVWISEYNQSQAHMEVGFPCTAAVVCWEKLKLLHLSCAERSILSPSVSQPLEQPRASAWHCCWGNAGKH